MVSGRSKLRGKYRRYASLYSGTMLHMDQVVPVQERNKDHVNTGRRY